MMFIIFLAFAVQAKEITTNDLTMANAPDWLTRPRVEKVTDRIKTHMEGTAAKKVSVTWYSTEEDYAKAQNLGPQSAAVTKVDGGLASIHLGPKVTNENFDEMLGHELVHVIVFQKYHGAVPKWLEEGIACYFSRTKPVDYKWLVKQPFPDDVHNLAHPFQGAPSEVEYRYKASQAFAEMLAKKCDLEELLRLSVTRKMEDYMHTYCEIKDLNEAFHKWVVAKAK